MTFSSAISRLLTLEGAFSLIVKFLRTFVCSLHLALGVMETGGGGSHAEPSQEQHLHDGEVGVVPLISNANVLILEQFVIAFISL